MRFFKGSTVQILTNSVITLINRKLLRTLYLLASIS